MGKGAKQAPPKKSGKKQNDEDFDDFLKQLNAATADNSGKKDTKALVTNDQRRQLHKEKRDEMEQKRKNDIEKMLLQHQQQQQLQKLIQDMMRSPFNAKANTEFNFQAAKSEQYDACCGWMQGWRSNMEDAHVIIPDFQKDDHAGLFAVFDGHGGAKCAQLCQAVLPVTSLKNYNGSTKSIDFNKLYLDLDVSLKAKMTDTSGSTAVSVLITDTTVTCASVGDSRAVLCRASGKAVDLSDDHKPENEDERARIEAAGGHVADNRVNGELAMSRALGDFQYKSKPDLAVDKQLVIPIPDIISAPREKGDKFVLICCDGIFDVLSNQEACDFVRKELESETRLSLDEICKKVCMHCLAPEDQNGRPSRAAGTDNMTITIVVLK
eukprot:GILI01019559.1.p1 GENE.GILI01019559.1~~GILI01019559.1.p1  ORF type:complete len:381 (-),score=51.78 GILI01019559.1:55-1197(-)